MDKQLCRNCPHLKSKQARPRAITTVYWCGKVGNFEKGTSIGCYPWIDKPHPKCPLKKKGGAE